MTFPGCTSVLFSVKQAMSIISHLCYSPEYFSNEFLNLFNQGIIAF